MNVSSNPASFDIPARGPRARTSRLMLETAITLMQGGTVPSVSEVAERAGVSRATAYRYFPTQASLVQAVVSKALGPGVGWSSEETDAEIRIENLFTSSMPRVVKFETIFRAAMIHALQHSLQRRGGIETDEPEFKRGQRVELLRAALAPLESQLPPDRLDRLTKALSLVFGVETLIIMTDIWNAEPTETGAVAIWAARALVRAAIAEESAQSGQTK